MTSSVGPWKQLREAAKLSQREAERRMGWDKRGHLSLIERGISPSPDQERDLRRLYAALLLGDQL